MEPRFILKTHTEALRPGNYSLLIAKCTYPDKGSYPESVIKKLQEWISEKSVAKFTVLLSTKKNRGFGFLLDNMIWSWKGHVINLMLNYLHKKESNDPDAFLAELTMIERIGYLKFFLETEGAIVLKLAQEFSQQGELTYSYIEKNILRFFEEILAEYLEISADFRSRSKIRNLQKQMKSQRKTKEDYNEDTKVHKIKPHIQALSDLGILIIETQNDEEFYRPRSFNKLSTFAIIVNELENLQKMEKIFSNDGYFPLIAKAYNLTHAKYSYEIHNNLLGETISYAYEVMRDKVTGMADIDALAEWCSIKLLSEDGILIKRQDIEYFLNEFRKRYPSSIRYHVDGQGKIAYLIFSEPL